MSKIKEIIIEPSKIIAGSTFLLKIKATRYLTYGEVKEKTISEMKQFTIAEVKGE